MSTEGMFGRLTGRMDDTDEVATPLTVSDLLEFPDDERAIVRHILRAPTPLTVTELAAELGEPADTVAKLVGALSMRGVVAAVDGKLKISPMHSAARVSPGGLWGQLNDL